MHVISLKALREFWKVHGQAEKPMRAWHTATEKAAWSNFADVRRTFNTADLVDEFVVFDTGGNKYRIVTMVMYEAKRVYVREVFKHAEYDAWSKTQRRRKR